LKELYLIMSIMQFGFMEKLMKIMGNSILEVLKF
jgi:hypothetical protein